jgi:uncharacterized membrane protein YqjE
MVEPTTPGAGSSGEAGLGDHLRVLAASIAGYLQARLQLAGLESKEAFGHCLKILLVIAAAAAAAFFGYVFFGAAVVFFAARLLCIHWAWAALGFGAIHLAAAIACLLAARKKMAAPMFAATLNEFKKDQEWLKTSSKPN